MKGQLSVRAVRRVIQTALAIHVTLTILDNVPENATSLGIRLPVFKKIPQWRFFAPNPGVEDIYLMYRTRREAGAVWEPWRDIPLQVKQSPVNFVWNPGSRSFKALYDATEQLRRLATYRAPNEFVYKSEGFEIISDLVESRAREGVGAESCQFMILSALPGELPGDTAQPRPILVSPPRFIGEILPKAAP